MALERLGRSFNLMRNCSGQASQGAECINNGCQSRRRHRGKWLHLRAAGNPNSIRAAGVCRGEPFP